MSLDKRIATSEFSYSISEEKHMRTNVIFVIRNKKTVQTVQTVLITAGPGVKTYNASKQHLHGQFHISSSESKYLET